MFNWLKNLFKRSEVAIYVTDSYLEILEVGNDFGKVMVKNYAYQRIVPGLVVNGEIIDQKAISAEIVNLLKSAKPLPIKTKKCLLAIPQPQIYDEIFEISTTDNLEAEIANKVGETIPVDLDKLHYQYRIVKSDEKRIVSVVAVKKQLIADYRKLFESCGLKPVTFEPSLASLLRNAPGNRDDQAAIMIDVSGNNLTWGVIWKRRVLISGFWNHAGDINGLLERLTRVKASFEGKMGVKVEKVVLARIPDDFDAEIIKQNLGIELEKVEKLNLGNEQFAVTGGLALLIANSGDKETDLLE